MVFFDYDRNGKKDWKDNAREYYLYNKFKEEEEKAKVKKQEADELKEQMKALEEKLKLVEG